MARRLGLVYLLGAVAFAGYVSVLAMREHYTVPYLDDWRMLDESFSLPLGQFLFRDQTGHRIPGTLLLLLLDYRLVGGHMHLLVAAALACAWVAAGALVVCARAERPCTVSAGATVAFAIFALFWAGSYHDFLWGTNQGSQQTAMSVVVALVAIALAARRERTRTLPLAVAGAAAVLATFSHGTGPAVWAGVVVVLVATGFRWRVVLAFALLAVVCVALYGTGLEHTGWSNPVRAYSRILGGRPLDILKFGAALVGSGVARAAGFGFHPDLYPVSLRVGTVGVALLTVYLLWIAVRRPVLSRLATVALGLMVFGCAAGSLVGMARVPFPTTAVQDRFITWSSLFWIGAVGTLASFADGHTNRRGALVVVVLATGSALLLPSLGAARMLQDGLRFGLGTRALASLAGVDEDHLSNYRGDVDPAVGRVLDRMRRDRRGIFDDERADLPGRALRERFPGTVAPCPGSVLGVTPAARGNPGAALTGVVEETAGADGVVDLVVVDARGVVQGLGVVAPAGGQGATARKIAAFVTPFDPAASYAVYGVRPADGSACVLAPLARLPLKEPAAAAPRG